MSDQQAAARRPRVIIPFWAVIAAVAIILIVIIVVVLVSIFGNTTTRSTANSKACGSYASVANGFIKLVESAHSGTSTPAELAQATKALPGRIRGAADSATGTLHTTMLASASAAAYYTAHRSSFAATSKVFSSFTDVQHQCSSIGAGFSTG